MEASSDEGVKLLESVNGIATCIVSVGEIVTAVMAGRTFTVTVISAPAIFRLPAFPATATAST